MDNPGLSLFQNGVSLHVDAVHQQEAEEDEDEEEENRRIQQELQANLHGAFDDLDLDESEDYDGEETVEHSQDNRGGYPQQILTPGQVPLKNVTSTPFTANHYNQGVGRQFHQLAVEETSMMEGEQDNTYSQETDQGYTNQQINPPAKTVNFLPPSSNNHEYEMPVRSAAPVVNTIPSNQYVNNNINAYSTEASDHINRKMDYINKSDTEKVKENEHLFAMYTARGRQIEQLEEQLDTLRTDHASQMRQLRQHLASTAVEKEQQGHSLEELEQLLADTRRENQLLKDEIHPMKEKLSVLQETKESLEIEHSGDKETIIQLQQKIRLLESTDTVLRARQQYDALVRSIKERHEDEVQKLRVEIDTVSSSARDKDQEVSGLRSKLGEAQNNFDYMIREKTSLVDDLSRKCDEYQKKLLNNQSNDQAVEIARLQTSLDAITRRSKELEAESRSQESQIASLQSELQGYEVMGVDELSESMIALGLGRGTSKADGVTRLKEELHKSLGNNKTKREQISRLEETLSSKNEECEKLSKQIEKLSTELREVQNDFTNQANASGELDQLKDELVKQTNRNKELEAALKEADQQNIKVKKCMTEMVEGNQEDKMEAIDSLREEYEQHCQEAVQQTKSLMEGEIRRLKIELDVYNKTILELRRKLEATSKLENEEHIKKLQEKIQELEQKVESSATEKAALENLNTQLKLDSEHYKKKFDDLKANYDAKVNDDEASIPDKLEAVVEKRVEQVRSQFRDVWEKNRKGDIEEAVAAARLDWLRRLPEAEKPGGAARLSINQLEELKKKLSAVSQDKEKLQIKLSTENNRRQELEQNIENIRNDFVNVRKEQLESETRAHSDLCTALAKQAEQWQDRLATTRKEAEDQRKQFDERHDAERRQLEERLRSRETEAADLEAKLDRVETDFSLAMDKWRRVLEDKNQTIQSLKKNSNGDIELLKSELNLRVEEVDRQRAEMAAMADRWANEVKSIHATHQQEKKELSEMTEKYHSLKQKIRKYQRHVEQKENHYKQEYSRLENEFKSTLERLRERMELAYSAKEREVERELGNMRNQFTEELKNIASRKTGSERPVTPHDLLPPQSGDSGNPQSAVFDKENFEPPRSRSQQQDSLDNIKSGTLKQYYLQTSREIQQLLK